MTKMLMLREPVLCCCILLLCSLLFTPCTCRRKHGGEVDGMFVFGDSLSDNGNNNFIVNATARADYAPYGIDFSLGHTGRFSNGKNWIDVLGELLKLPPYLPVFKDQSTKGKRILNGVNYASGASGILAATTSATGGVIPLNQQVKNFEEVTLPELRAQLDSLSLRKYLFTLETGGNDLLLDYFFPSSTNKNVSLLDYTTKLIRNLSKQIEKLHLLGARKYVLVAVYPLGCIPYSIVLYSNITECVDYFNDAARLFNSQLQSLMGDLKLKLHGSHFVYVNSYNIIRDIILDPRSAGFQDTSNPCCEMIPVNEGGSYILCKRDGLVCVDRHRYLFYDGVHHTEALSEVIATKAYASSKISYVYPLNIEKLTKI